jgi:Tol biopolymer transport system component
VGEIAWLPDGNGLVLNAQDKPMFLASQIWELSYPAGEARRITNDLNFYRGVSVNGDGTALVTVQQDLSADLWVVTPEEGAEPFRVTSSSRTFDGFGVTWIGEDRIVYASNAAGSIHLWSIGADGGDPVQLTSEAHNYPFPVASADGRYLMVPSDRAGGVNIWRMEADGSNLTQITDGAFDVEPSISLDGQWVVYIGGSNSTLLKVSVEGGEPEEILDRWCNASKFSPDGTQIAVRNWHEDEKKWKVDLIPFQGGEPTGTLEIRGNYEWSPDGRAITYADGEGGVENIWSQPLDGGEPRQLTHFEKDWIGWHAWAPDGKRLVVSRGQSHTDVVLIRNFR